MATIRDIRLRIKGVQNTQQITKAMKMVAAAKLRRSQEAIVNARPYARRIAVMLSHLISDEERMNNPFIAQREIKNIAFVVVTADRGLCGAFNTNILREAVKFIEDNNLKSPDINIHLFCIGRKGFDFLSKREYNVFGKQIGIFSTLNYGMALSITQELVQEYLKGTFDKIVIIYNEFKSIIQQKIVLEQFLPIPRPDLEKAENKDYSNYIFEPDLKQIIQFLLPKHLKAQMWRIMLESNAAELGARMTAMDNATTNAKELIRSLKLTYNKERQASITKEILEIVSGANALKTND